MNNPVTLQATVHGRVQGVYFRAFVSSHARKLGLTGYVRNTPQGTVEVHAEGEKQQLERLRKHLESGPVAARVDEVVTSWLDFTGSYEDFKISHR